MPTFIKTGYWEKVQKGYKGWLNLDDIVNGSIGTGTTNRLPKYIGPNTLGDSIISATSTLVSNNFGTSNLYFGQSGSTRFGYAAGTATLGFSTNLPLVIGTYDGMPLVFGTNNTENVRIFLDGNVGIGTGDSNSGFKLDVAGGDARINTINIGLGGGSISTNTRVGASALNANTSGTSNVAFGNSTMLNNTTGINNVVVGTEAMYTSTTGSNNNVIVGRQAAYYCTAIVDSIAIGAAALSNALNSQRNIAIGRQSMINSVSGNDNTAIGYRALYGSASSTYANSTAIGSNALGGMLSGGNNTAIGFEAGAYAPTAGNNNTTSSNSIYIGYRAGASANGNTNEIIIGYDTAGNGSNTTTLGNSSTVGTYLRGKTILAASATARASLNITTGAAPTTPSDGDIWFDGTALRIRIAGVTRTINVT